MATRWTPSALRGPCCVKNRLVRESDRNAHVGPYSRARPRPFLACFDSLRSPFGPAFGCYSRWSLRLA
ncbi:hypothetical protein PCL1606_45030 [Pseudomonas chlororaphis]|uniref:Uncharacterized protein n=1 Tax=Pseudomonas chlororaphis TaxID=587753 RepID=A0A0D5Y4H6_9PSED|nr:hypothetical protein PCL1606_45030 [Pseudomonas chlororaphis]